MQTYADMNRIICRWCGQAQTCDINEHKKHELLCRDRERLERIATAVLTGFASNTRWDAESEARNAVLWAKALIAELDREEGS